MNLSASERPDHGFETTGAAGTGVTWVRRALGPLIIAAFFIGVVFLVPPKGEFPINDDWDYYATVADLLQYGEIRLSDWPAMSLVAQIAWGGFFSKLFGLSYFTLRMSVITLAFVGALTLYFWARVIGRTRAESTFLALLFASSPLVLTTSYSFMTDVPAASVMLVCFLVQSVCGRRGGAHLFALAGVVGGIGYLIRQTAALPALILAASMVPALFQRRARWRDFFALLMPLALVVIGRHVWLDYFHGFPYATAMRRFEMFGPKEFLQRILQQAVAISVYLSPLLVCLFGGRTRLRSWASRGVIRAIAAVVVVSVTFLSGTDFPPPFTQYVGDLYLGYEPVSHSSLRGARIAWGPVSLDVLAIISVIGLLSLSMAVAFLVPVGPFRRESWRLARFAEGLQSPANQAGWCALALMGLMVVQPVPFDRYLIPIIPVLALFILSRMPRDGNLLRSPAPWGLLGVVAVVSVAGTQDYFARATERWRAVDHLVHSGISPKEIDAGFEHEGLFLFEPHYRQPVRVRPYLVNLPEEEREKMISLENPLDASPGQWKYQVTYDPIYKAEPYAVFPWHGWARSGEVYVYYRKRKK